jgi:hypothetical protein
MPNDVKSRLLLSTALSKVVLMQCDEIHFEILSRYAQVTWAPSLDSVTGVIDAAVLVNVPFPEAVSLSDQCRSRLIKTVLARSLGAAGCVFCDFIDHSATRSVPLGADQPVSSDVIFWV